jgi:hypothetical protein
MTDFIASSVVITAFFGFVTTLLFGIPFVPNFTFSRSIYIDLIVRRMFFVFGLSSLLVWFTNVMTIVGLDGVSLGGYSAMVIQIITLALYVSIVYMFLKMLFDLRLLVKVGKQSKSRGDDEPEDAE